MRRRVILISSTMLLIACCGCVGYLGPGYYDGEGYYDLGEGVRGYGERHYEGTRSSAFEHSGNSQFERAASDRGFQSRSKAGHISSGRGSSGGGGGGFHGGKR